MIATSAGLLGMLPKGLVLLISVDLAVGVVRLSKKNVLVRNLHSLKNLAHCDVVCLDKTCTLTDGRLAVEAVYPYMDEGEFGRLMATYLVHTTDNNTTYQALHARFSAENSYEITGATTLSPYTEMYLFVLRWFQTRQVIIANKFIPHPSVFVCNELIH